MTWAQLPIGRRFKQYAADIRIYRKVSRFRASYHNSAGEEVIVRIRNPAMLVVILYP